MSIPESIPEDKELNQIIDIVGSVYGSGLGDCSGHGYGSGSGCGYGDGSGYGYGFVAGCGSGSGSGYGYGSVAGCGFGDGSGEDSCDEYSYYNGNSFFN